MAAGRTCWVSTRPAGGPALRARVGVMLQGGGIDPRANPRETLRQYGGFHVDPRDPDELLDLVGLRTVAGTRYRRLSGGERQRLGLALALVGRPEVLILDEPTAGMDPEARAATRAIVAGLRDAGAAVLLTSHDLTDVERLADRICVIDDGRIVASGSPAGLAAGSTPRLRFRLDRELGGDEIAGLLATLREGRPEAALAADGSAWAVPARWRPAGSAPGRRGRRLVCRPPVGSSSSFGRQAGISRRSISTWSVTGMSGAREPPGVALGGHAVPGPDGADADRPSRRERPGHDHHPGRRPALLREREGPADG